MNLVEVDIVGTQSLQAILTLGNDAVTTRILMDLTLISIVIMGGKVINLEEYKKVMSLE